MNGAECGQCGYLQCRCEENKRAEARSRLRKGYYVTGVKLDQAIEKLYRFLIKPKGMRLKLLKWMYPEVVEIANMLREYYWSNDEAA